MPKVWQAWNSLPSSYDRVLRVSCLQNGRLLPAEGKRKGKVCWKCPPEDFALLYSAAWWREFVERVAGRAKEVTDGGHLVDWMVFRDITAMNVDAVASIRAAKELDETITEGGSPKRPSWQFIEDTKLRFEDYAKARRQANEQLFNLLVPKRLTRPLAASRSLNIRRQWLSDASLPHIKTQALMVPPPHLLVAALHAHQLIHPDSLASFFENSFWSLRPGEAKEMVALYQRPVRSEGDFGALSVWLADNGPVFRRFDWGWKDIYDELAESKRFDRYPKSDSALRDCAYRCGLTPLIGAGGQTWGKFKRRGAHLLTPAPMVALVPATTARRATRP